MSFPGLGEHTIVNSLARTAIQGQEAVSKLIRSIIAEQAAITRLRRISTGPSSGGGRGESPTLSCPARVPSWRGGRTPRQRAGLRAGRPAEGRSHLSWPAKSWNNGFTSFWFFLDSKTIIVRSLLHIDLTDRGNLGKETLNDGRLHNKYSP